MGLKLENSTAILRGKLVPFNQANLSIASSTVLYGLCIYTVFPANWDVENSQLWLFRLRDHYERLRRSARILDMQNVDEILSFAKFKNLMLDLVRVNHVKEDALIRVMIFVDEISAGTKIGGLKNSIMAYVYPMGEILPRNGAHVCVSSWTRTSDNMIPSRAKINGSYINASLMKHEALLNGYDDAIALDMHGHVAEGTVANLLMVREGRLITPSVHTDILEGLTRNTVGRLSEFLGLEYIERTVDRSELYLADEVMFVGSSANITPILSVDKRKISDGKIGSITKKLNQAYSDLQKARIPEFMYWLDPVYET